MSIFKKVKIFGIRSLREELFIFAWLSLSGPLNQWRSVRKSSQN